MRPAPTRPAIAEDLAPVELEADVTHLPATIEVADLEHDRRIGLLGQLRRRLEDRPADHHADDLLDVEASAVLTVSM